MTITATVLLFVVLVNSLFAIRLVIDLYKHKDEVYADPANPWLLSITSPILFFFSTFGIPDFALSTILYRMKKLVSDKKLPGTLNTQCVIPVALMAIIFISSIQVEITTLIVCIISQVLGAYIGPYLVVRLPASSIRKCICIGLFVAAIALIAGQLSLMPSGGHASGLTGLKLYVAACCLFIFGVLNNIGIGCYPLTMATIYLLGMNPIIAFPIMMGACAFSIPIASIQFVKLGEYSRKITLFSSTLGLLGVLAGVYLVKGLNLSLLQWLVAGILLYSSGDMLLADLRLKNKAEARLDPAT